MSAADFTGTVTNEKGEAIQSVAIDILGPRKIFTRSDNDGRFSVDLVNGSYTIRLRYQNKSTDYSVKIGGKSGISSRTFVLDY